VEAAGGDGEDKTRLNSDLYDFHDFFDFKIRGIIFKAFFDLPSGGIILITGITVQTFYDLPSPKS